MIGQYQAEVSLAGSFSPDDHTHDLLSSNAMAMILARISGGRTSRLHGFLVEKTFLPIWKLTEDESP